jgi:hypothetical protein
MNRCVRPFFAGAFVLVCGISVVRAEPTAEPPTGKAQTGSSAKPAAARPANPPPSDQSEYENGQGGILYGKGWAFVIAAPKGWLMEERGEMLGGQVNAAFYRRGQSWEKADAVMYVSVVPKIKGEDDTLDKVMRSDIAQTKAHDPKMKAEPQPWQETGDGRKAVVYTFTGPGIGRAAERVAYIDTPHSVIMLVLTAHGETAYTAATADYATLIRSFGFITGGVKVEYTGRASATGRAGHR